MVKVLFSLIPDKFKDEYEEFLYLPYFNGFTYYLEEYPGWAAKVVRAK